MTNKRGGGMIFYKLLHKPTGMFWTPSKYKNGHRNLSKKGKIYHTKPNPESWMRFRGEYIYNHPINEYPYYEIRRTVLNDWEIKEYKLED